MRGASPRETLDLADYRLRVAELYLATAVEGPGAVAEFRDRRDRLFLEHPASALTAVQRERFDGLDYFEFDPAARVECELARTDDSDQLRIDSGGEDGVVSYARVGRLATPWGELTLFWTEGYGGGLFLPFRDATAPTETYGAGRYLTDTIKGSYRGGLEIVEGEQTAVVLDFNYAYNPSCAYNSRWACPLAPPENRLDAAIQAGERKYPDPV